MCTLKIVIFNMITKQHRDVTYFYNNRQKYVIILIEVVIFLWVINQGHDYCNQNGFL